MFKGAKLIRVIFQIQTGRHIHRLDSIRMEWEYDGAIIERRKYLTCHPLDRNRLQMQDTEGLGQREVNARWVDWEEKVMCIKDLQLGKGTEDIDRILHFPTNQSEGREGREVLEVKSLYKIECSIWVKDLHYSKARGDSCDEFAEKWLQEVSKVAICGEFEGLEMLYRVDDLQTLVFSRRWE